MQVWVWQCKCIYPYVSLISVQMSYDASGERSAGCNETTCIYLRAVWIFLGSFEKNILSALQFLQDFVFIAISPSGTQ